jgi:hypothetical protein
VIVGTPGQLLQVGADLRVARFAQKVRGSSARHEYGVEMQWPVTHDAGRVRRAIAFVSLRQVSRLHRKPRRVHDHVLRQGCLKFGLHRGVRRRHDDADALGLR